MNLSHLYYFKKLAEVKHFTRAAEELFIAQPTLSVAINRLEDELGAPLFERNRANVELTEQGEQFYQFVSAGLADIERGVQLVREHADKVNGAINLGSLYAIQGRDWSQALYRFRESSKHHPQINVKQGYSTELVRELRQGRLDVAFASKMDDDPGLNYTLCWSQQLVACMHKGHPLLKRKELRLEDLRGYRVLTYQPASPVYAHVREVADAAGISIDPSYDDEVTMASLLASDPHTVGLFCYSYLVKAFDDLAFLPVANVPADFHKVYMVTRREPHPRILDEFIAFMAAYRFPSVTL